MAQDGQINDLDVHPLNLTELLRTASMVDTNTDLILDPARFSLSHLGWGTGEELSRDDSVYVFRKARRLLALTLLEMKFLAATTLYI